MPSDQPDDMDNPAFSPRQLAQLDKRFATVDKKVDELSTSVNKRFEQIDNRLSHFMTREEFTHTMNSMFEHYMGLVRAMFEPVYAKLEELTSVKPRVDTLVAAELPSRVGRLERKVFPPARSQRAGTKRSRPRRG